MIRNINLALVALLLVFVYSPVEVAAQNAKCDVDSYGGQCQPLVPENPINSLNAEPCDFRKRELDGTCTNERERTWGAAGTAHFSYFDSDSTIATGTTRESARLISNVVASQRDDMFNDRGLSELLVFFGQFIDHNVVRSPASDESMDIEIPHGDPLFANFTNGKLPFARSQRVTVGINDNRMRPENVLSSAVDLAALYSASEERFKSLTVRNRCKMRTSGNNFLPLNEDGIENDPIRTNEFFLAGDVRSNENPLLTAFHTVFLREHNRICDDLVGVAPDENRRFDLARQMNTAQFQKIVFDEFYPAITGRRLPAYTGHKKSTNVAMSLIFSTAAFRIGHTMIGNTLQLRGPGNVPMSALQARDMFFQPASFFTPLGPEPFILGAAGQMAQEVDTQVMDSLRQVLFSNVPAFSSGVDLIALNLQRGRDHALPNYNTVRNLFGLRAFSSFTEVTKNIALQARLQAVYDGPNDMDLWVALLAEDHRPRSSMGQTMLAVWEAEFRRLRDGDRLYYENNPDRFYPELIEVYGGLPALRRQKELFRQIILRNTNIADADLPDTIFMV